MRKLLLVDSARHARGRLHGLRDQEVRAQRGRPGEREGRRALDAARGDAGAHRKNEAAIGEVDQKAERPASRRRRAQSAAATRAQTAKPPRPTATNADGRRDRHASGSSTKSS